MGSAWLYYCRDHSRNGDRLILSRLWRHTPNALSTARLLATPVLLWAAIAGNRALFTWLLLACLLSDILDGLIARVFKLRSELGARLDSAADLIVFGIAIVGLVRFESDVLRAHWLALTSVLALYLGEAGFAFLRYGRISSFHTWLVRTSAYLQGIFVMSLFLWGYRAWLLRVTASVSLIAYGEEIILVALLPTWRADVRGLFWVLRSRQAVADA